MGKPRMIILVRHAQSEGNKNRDIHQYIPDHRVKLTPDGVLQAEDAGRRLRALLKPDDTIQFFTSPYRRTRETTEGILRTLTSNEDGLGPSPFPRDKIKVYEEPRLREQDFGNFQPCSAEMERMWQERADYGHFFYRIQNGESAADAYDRVSGFNESLWRQMADSDFPSVCVLVTHGLMTRIFLMKWYHWSVEYFEDLRNINHCEFINMKQNPDNGKFILQNELRTWSDLKRRTAAQVGSSASLAAPAAPKARVWGGCAMGCDHANMNYPQKPRRQNTQDFIGAGVQLHSHEEAKEKEDKTAQDAEAGTPKKRASSRTKSGVSLTAAGQSPHKEGTAPGKGKSEAENPDLTPSSSSAAMEDEGDDSEGENVGRELDGSDGDADADSSSPISSPKKAASYLQLPLRNRNRTTPSTRLGRDFGGSKSGLGSPVDISDEADDSDWFDTNVHQIQKRMSVSHGSRSELSRSMLSQINEGVSSSPPKNGGLKNGRSGSLNRSGSARKTSSSKGTAKTEEELLVESGMAENRRADALGDMDEDEVEEAKMEDRKGFGEVY